MDILAKEGEEQAMSQFNCFVICDNLLLFERWIFLDAFDKKRKFFLILEIKKRSRPPLYSQKSIRLLNAEQKRNHLIILTHSTFKILEKRMPTHVLVALLSKVELAVSKVNLPLPYCNVVPFVMSIIILPKIKSDLMP
ncbi:hypothetical protein NC651_003839 [Populus alba x Populus x berolinensis]|nr:hypothetical protein NC651_003839 [Populus alba x Populus x berolinensis]